MPRVSAEELTVINGGWVVMDLNFGLDMKAPIHAWYEGKGERTEPQTKHQLSTNSSLRTSYPCLNVHFEKGMVEFGISSFYI
jgi:hypothetical protein